MATYYVLQNGERIASISTFGGIVDAKRALADFEKSEGLSGLTLEYVSTSNS